MLKIKQFNLIKLDARDRTGHLFAWSFNMFKIVSLVPIQMFTTKDFAIGWVLNNINFLRGPRLNALTLLLLLVIHEVSHLAENINIFLIIASEQVV